MDKNRLQQILDKTYELEGLIHLSLARLDDMPAMLPDLIAAKIAELYDTYSYTSDQSDQSDRLDRTDASDHSDFSDQSEVSDQSDPTDASDRSDPTDRIIPERATQTRPTNAVFSLNDRFLYIRELFDGSAKAFDDALLALASMETMDEAEEYFYDECGFIPEDDTVAGFMQSVKRYLESK